MYFFAEAQVWGHFRLLSMSYSLVFLAKNIKHKVICDFYEVTVNENITVTSF